LRSSCRTSSETWADGAVATPLATRHKYNADGTGVGSAVWSPGTKTQCSGAISQVTYPSGLAVRYVRDPATREVTRVENVATGQAYASQVTHAPGGPVRSLTFGNGL
jgi:hypothetical protein